MDGFFQEIGFDLPIVMLGNFDPSMTRQITHAVAKNFYRFTAGIPQTALLFLKERMMTHGCQQKEGVAVAEVLHIGYSKVLATTTLIFRQANLVFQTASC